MSCLLCGEKAMITRQENSSRNIYNCKKCGMYLVSDLAEEDALAHRHELLAFVRSRKLTGQSDVVLISFEKANPDKDYMQITVSQIVDLFPKSLGEQMDKALHNLELLSAYPGDEVRIESLDDAPLFYMKHDGFDPLSFVIKAMNGAGLIEVNYYGATFFPCGIVISPAGWERLEGQRGESAGRRRLLLLGNRESENGQELARAVQRAARAEGLEPMDAALLGERGRVSNGLIACARRCDLLVCDLDGAGPDIYYAAGYAQALGKQVLFLLHESENRPEGIDPAETGLLRWKDKKQLAQLLSGYIGAKL